MVLSHIGWLWTLQVTSPHPHRRPACIRAPAPREHRVRRVVLAAAHALANAGARARKFEAPVCSVECEGMHARASLGEMSA